MDVSIVDHSDSDSGESWTLLDHSENPPLYADDVPIFPQNDIEHERTTVLQSNEKDDDTDGISIISDSDPETTPCDISYDRCLLADEPSVEQDTQYIPTKSLPPYPTEDHESLRSGDFLGDSHGKLKTYVHRRNKRLSTVLNIIMLGSVITAAGVAIGHMWGARNDCTMHTTPTLNKILSNLYKLQEENAYLRSKLKELTLMTNTQLQKKLGADKFSVKQPRCRKTYEESLDKKNTDKITKCVDMLEPTLTPPEYEKEFLNDIDKLKNIYHQNKSWLDDEIAKRMKNEKETIKKMKSTIKIIDLSPVDEEFSEHKDTNIEGTIKVQDASTFESVAKNAQQDSQNVSENLVEQNLSNIAMERITYADSLKSGENGKKYQKRDIKDKFGKNQYKKKGKKPPKLPPEVNRSEEDFTKDHRYVGPKMKEQQKKHDHQKSLKKQKRKNKYEQWEMKGGIMKDYDAFSITSSLENEHILKQPDQIFNKDFVNFEQFRHNDIPKIRIIDADMHSDKYDKHSLTDKRNEKKAKDTNWYEKRAALRTEARRKLEMELFGESSTNSGGWYFRRMQRREQCRAKGDNSTYRKRHETKRNMNFKSKH